MTAVLALASFFACTILSLSSSAALSGSSWVSKVAGTGWGMIFARGFGASLTIDVISNLLLVAGFVSGLFTGGGAMTAIGATGATVSLALGAVMVVSFMAG